ncbi:MAG: ABC transporter ATP-binding protein, partial [Christensenella sp.]|nr:ABC transporter ATP-binding protein [Christensenella sp.]
DLLYLIKQLSVADGRTVLVSSHQLYQIQQICDRVGIFVKGKLIACGQIEELGKAVRGDEPLSIEFAAAPDNGELENTLRAVPGVIRMKKERNMYVIQSQTDIRAQLAQEAVRQGFFMEHLKLRGGDLDDIYRRYFAKEGAV